MRASLLAAILAAASTAPLAAPPAAFGWFAELAGSCWTGTRADNVTSDTHCYLMQYEKLVRGSIKATVEGKPHFEGDAVYAINPADSTKVVYTQWGTGGVYATGDMVPDGETLVFRNRKADGEPSGIRHVWRRTGPEGFRVTHERQEGEKWVEMFSQEYKRIPARKAG